MPKTFKVISQVIRMRRHGGIYAGRNNVEYPIRDAAQYACLKELENVGEVQIMCSPEERSEYEASPDEPKKVDAPKPAQKPAEEPKQPEAPKASGDKEDGEETADQFAGDSEDVGGDI